MCLITEGCINPDPPDCEDGRHPREGSNNSMNNEFIVYLTPFCCRKAIFYISIPFLEFSRPENTTFGPNNVPIQGSGFSILL